MSEPFHDLTAPREDHPAPGAAPPSHQAMPHGQGYQKPDRWLTRPATWRAYAAGGRAALSLAGPRWPLLALTEAFQEG